MSENYQPTCVLITGGAGFIASSVAVHFALTYPDYKVTHERGNVASLCAGCCD